VLTWEDVEKRKAKGVRFLRNVVQDDDRADDLEDESLEDYAERKRFAVANPLAQMNPKTAKEGKKMPKIRIFNPGGTNGGAATRGKSTLAAAGNPTLANPSVSKADLLERIRLLESENSDLQDQLDQIADAASAPEGDVEETEDRLMDKLNKVLDLAAPDAVDDDDDEDATDDEDDDQD
jgi:hypothetical protein